MKEKMVVKKTSRMVMVPAKVTVYHVTMSQADAEDLVSLLSNIGGSPDGPRGAVDRLRHGLLDAGIKERNHVSMTRDGYFEYKKSFSRS